MAEPSVLPLCVITCRSLPARQRVLSRPLTPQVAGNFGHSDRAHDGAERGQRAREKRFHLLDRAPIHHANETLVAASVDRLALRKENQWVQIDRMADPANPLPV